MKEESIQALIEESKSSNASMNDDILERNQIVSMQTTLFPDENYHGVMDGKSQREFRDRYCWTSMTYDLLLDCDFDDDKLKGELNKLIKKEPDFLYPYLTLAKILKKEDQVIEANKILENAYTWALNLIIDG